MYLDRKKIQDESTLVSYPDAAALNKYVGRVVQYVGDSSGVIGGQGEREGDLDRVSGVWEDSQGRWLRDPVGT